MKDGSESELRMARGMEFQRVGAATAKVLSPMVRYLVLVMGGEGVGISGACSVGVNGAMEEICQV